LALSVLATTVAIGFAAAPADDGNQWWDAALVIAVAATVTAIADDLQGLRARRRDGRGWAILGGVLTVLVGSIQALAFAVAALAGAGATHWEWLLPLGLALIAVGVAAIISTPRNRGRICVIAITLVVGDAVTLVAGNDVWRPAMAAAVALPAVWFAFALAHSSR
jgi:uncharacterized membrane protein HdeD (DUF308 family)